MKKVNLRNSQQNLHRVLENAWAKLQDKAVKPVTHEDIAKAKIEIIEADIAVIKHQWENYRTCLP